MSALYGIYVQRRSIDLDMTLETLDIDDIPLSLTDDERQATVRHLLKSRSGVYHEAAAEMPEIAALRPERGSHLPDTFFTITTGILTLPVQFSGRKPTKTFFKRLKEKLRMLSVCRILVLPTAITIMS